MNVYDLNDILNELNLKLINNNTWQMFITMILLIYEKKTTKRKELNKNDNHNYRFITRYGN